MDDGRPHGPDTTDTSSASKPDLALQSPAAWSLSPGSSHSSSQSENALKNASIFLIFLLKSWSPPVPPRSFYCDVARLSRKTRSYLIYSAGPLRIRCPASAAAAADSALYSRFVDAPPRRSEANSAACRFMTTGSRCGCRLGTFLFQARQRESMLAEISIKITDLTPPTSTPLFVEHGWPI